MRFADPTPPLPAAAGDSFCDGGNPLLHPVCLAREGLGGVLGDAVGGALHDLATAVVGMTTAVLGAVLEFLAAPVRPDLGSDWLTGQLGRMATVSATFATLFFLLGIGAAVARGRGADLARVVGWTVAALAGSGVAVVLAQLLVAVTDALSAEVAAGAPRDLVETFDALMSPLVTLAAGPGGQGLLAMFFGIAVALAALAVYVELFVRNVMIHVVVYFLPLMLVGTIWGPTRRWGRRGIEFLAVLIFSKFVIYAVIALGWSAVSAFDDQRLSTSWASVLTAIVLLGVAAYLPWLIFKLLPFMEAHVHGALNRRDVRAAATAPVVGATAPLRVLEGNLRRAATVAAYAKGGPMAAAAVNGGLGGPGGRASGPAPIVPALGSGRGGARGAAVPGAAGATTGTAAARSGPPAGPPPRPPGPAARPGPPAARPGGGQR